ncbi:HD-GYP domain-containing protein [Alteromonas confluentis]|uniref:Metal-dependent phosphohydrolase n=1 Tax=Alteromonas confluentis TaxID=1656094 RepID=A0A1E7ZDS4_9ALTE|nr:HD-GYP domain-containing protein [Alteromonas confluentis]OFC71663.1 metal-dependent phosphohydrolase [Alteromonas confluentis]
MIKTITINELTPGMFVHEITEQSGKVKIKSQGRVASEAVVDSLRARGVLKLRIDLSKQFDPRNGTPIPTAVQEAPANTRKAAKTSFASELINAESLYKQGKKIQHTLLQAVEKGLPFDDRIPSEFSHKLVASVERNPDALLCLTRIREKDDYLLEHSLNVAIILANFARFVGMNDDEVQELAYAGFLHDMGKIRIPDDILHKPGRLTDQEMDVMKKHVQFGVEALEEVNLNAALIRTVSEHHERLDGGGYPAGTASNGISHAGRMLAIADMYDALTADRCYKAGMPSQRAFQILISESPHKLDKGLVQQFIKCMGVYPVGSLVLLSNDKLAMVLAQNDSPLTPKVKQFYSTKGGHYITPKDVDLEADTRITIVKAVRASDYKINFNEFFNQSIAP